VTPTATEKKTGNGGGVWVFAVALGGHGRVGQDNSALIARRGAVTTSVLGPITRSQPGAAGGRFRQSCAERVAVWRLRS
jgi:hypothetical protein